MSWIQTHSGEAFSFQEYRPETIKIEDIAHALANLCRFVGHTDRYYSVAEHCVVMSRQVDPEHALEALMHDAAEAYIGDVSRPLKSMLPEYQELQYTVEFWIKTRFGLSHEMPQAVKQADKRMLITECEQLLWPPAAPWDGLEGVAPFDDMRLSCLPPETAKRQFLDRYATLRNEADSGLEESQMQPVGELEIVDENNGYVTLRAPWD